MSVNVRVPTPLRKFTSGQEEIKVVAGSIRELLQGLQQEHPGLSERICDEDGRFRRFVNVYLNGEDIRFLEQESTSLSDGDELSIVPAIAGG